MRKRRKFGDPLSRGFMDDMERVGTVVTLAARVEVPWLLIHGTADDVVPFAESTEIREAAGTNAELVGLEQADHLFTGQEREMARIVTAWLERD